MANQMKRSLPLVLCLLALGAAVVDAQAEEREELFGASRTMSIELQAPWRKLVRKKNDTQWPATLVFTDSGGETHRLTLTVERRGISRQEVCDFPPIRLRFDKESVKDTIFDGQGALKLVTHCDDGERWTQYYVLEMLAYRIYNLFTDKSFRVRPLQVVYTDVDRDRDPAPRFGFLIEDVDQLAKRHDLEEVEVARVWPSQLDHTEMSRVALFQYMIGNLDWSPLTGPEKSCCHNTKLIGAAPDAYPLIPVPYDFDSSGFVDAHYALPPEKLPVKSVRTRLYRGYCEHHDTMPAVRAQVLGLENEILELIRSESRLTQRSQESALSYLGEFFDILRSDARFEESINSQCRG